MKRFFTLLTSLFFLSNLLIAQKISPYFQLGIVQDDIANVGIQIEGKVTEAGYKVLGSYKPGNQSDLMVVVFTEQETETLCSNSGPQGLVASPYRIGLESSEGGVIISTINPEYQWRAYLTDNFETNKSAFDRLSKQYQGFCIKLGNGSLEPFGGEKDADDLEDYHYMFGMPYYEDQVSIKSFDSFETAISAIDKNINNTNGIKKVYQLSDAGEKIAVYGIGLIDDEIGESHFLSIIGQKHVAAMPYELIVDGNEVKMLHGRFRFALYWPELTMGTFTKIMSTPGDVEEMMKRIVN
jgi:hypothetical protein